MKVSSPVLVSSILSVAATFATNSDAGAEAKALTGKTVAILATNGFEESELLKPKAALEAAGAKTAVISPESGSIKAWAHDHWGTGVPVDVVLSSANAKNYDAIVLPGGVMNPDTLRMNPSAVAFVKSFVNDGKPIGAICHGPWTLIEAGGIEGKHITSWPSLRTDLTNAGGKWVDEEVVRDGKLITSRKPDDIPAFNKSLIEVIQAGS